MATFREFLGVSNRAQILASHPHCTLNVLPRSILTYPDQHISEVHFFCLLVIIYHSEWGEWTPHESTWSLVQIQTYYPQATIPTWVYAGNFSTRSTSQGGPSCKSSCCHEILACGVLLRFLCFNTAVVCVIACSQQSSLEILFESQ